MQSTKPAVQKNPCKEILQGFRKQLNLGPSSFPDGFVRRSHRKAWLEHGCGHTKERLYGLAPLSLDALFCIEYVKFSEWVASRNVENLLSIRHNDASGTLEQLWRISSFEGSYSELTKIPCVSGGVKPALTSVSVAGPDLTPGANLKSACSFVALDRSTAEELVKNRFPLGRPTDQERKKLLTEARDLLDPRLIPWLEFPYFPRGRC